MYPRRFNATCGSNRFRSDPCRISSESDIFHKKPIGSDRVFVGFLVTGIRPGFHRNSTEPDEIRPDPTRISSGSVEFRWNPGRIPVTRNPTKTLSDPIELFRSDSSSLTWVRKSIRTYFNLLNSSESTIIHHKLISFTAICKQYKKHGSCWTRGVQLTLMNAHKQERFFFN